MVLAAARAAVETRLKRKQLLSRTEHATKHELNDRQSKEVIAFLRKDRSTDYLAEISECIVKSNEIIFQMRLSITPSIARWRY
jgi:hypothetical protein